MLINIKSTHATSKNSAVGISLSIRGNLQPWNFDNELLNK